VVVYDLGAGTFDASVVRRGPNGFEVVAAEGLSQGGGLDIDAAIVGYLGAMGAGHDGAAWTRLLNPTTSEERRANRLLWEDVRQAKELLSRADHTHIHVPMVGVDVPLSRAQFEHLARPILDATINATRAALNGRPGGAGRRRRHLPRRRWQPDPAGGDAAASRRLGRRRRSPSSRNWWSPRAACGRPAGRWSPSRSRAAGFIAAGVRAAAFRRRRPRVCLVRGGAPPVAAACRPRPSRRINRWRRCQLQPPVPSQAGPQVPATPQRPERPRRTRLIAIVAAVVLVVAIGAVAPRHLPAQRADGGHEPLGARGRPAQHHVDRHQGDLEPAAVNLRYVNRDSEPWGLVCPSAAEDLQSSYLKVEGRAVFPVETWCTKNAAGGKPVPLAANDSGDSYAIFPVVPAKGTPFSLYWYGSKGRRSDTLSQARQGGAVAAR
jgi:hypothetical protein